jgi:hypothetical protein
MERMAMTPCLIRRVTEKTTDPTHKVVGPLRLKERPVAAIVEDDKGAQSEQRSNERKQQRPEIADRQQAVRQIPEEEERRDAVTDLPETSLQVRTQVSGWSLW